MKKFKTESKRVLEMMINSIYTHKEIFIRELISNASDAIDKLYYKSLTEGSGGLNRNDFFIRLETDKDKRILKIIDNGCGMTEDELDNNLGVIAKSGSEEFKKNISGEEEADVSIIGQFGVGFYSAFMVAKKVEVISKAYNSENAFKWSSNGAEGYTITPATKQERGTEIIMELKDDEDGETYGDFLSEYRLRELVKKYSDYIKYPIIMSCEKSRKKEKADEHDKDEYESYFEDETLNGMVPLWKKKKADITKEEYDSFYQSTFNDYTPPLKVIHTSAEGGSISYNALLYIPGKAPYNYFARNYEKGLRIYTNGVLIMEHCAELLPDYFRFVQGLVDCDLTLNVSRETVQQNRQVKAIASNLEKKIKNELTNMLENDRETYEKFFTEFGVQLKYGIYDNWGEHKDLLKDLVLFRSVKENKLITFKEYAENCLNDQKEIYYCSGKSADAIKNSPQCESLLEKGYDVLCLLDDVDEFAIKFLNEYEGKTFKSVSDESLKLDDKEKPEGADNENAALLGIMKSALKDAVKDVRVSNRLKTHAVCLTSEGEISIEMEKVLKNMPNAQEGIKAVKILEINPNHPIFAKLNSYVGNDEERIAKLTTVLYNQARLIEGLEIDDPTEYSKLVCELLS